MNVTKFFYKLLVGGRKVYANRVSGAGNHLNPKTDFIIIHLKTDLIIIQGHDLIWVRITERGMHGLFRRKTIR